MEVSAYYNKSPGKRNNLTEAGKLVSAPDIVVQAAKNGTRIAAGHKPVALPPPPEQGRVAQLSTVAP